MSHKLQEKTSILVLAALGVVFGDIGTSPLYALKVCFTGHTAIEPSPANVLGLVSLIFWSLTLVVSVKYALFILRADDQGEGGVFAMLALLHKGMGANLGQRHGPGRALRLRPALWRWPDHPGHFGPLRPGGPGSSHQPGQTGDSAPHLRRPVSALSGRKDMAPVGSANFSVPS